MLTFTLRTGAGSSPALYAAVPGTADGCNSLYYLASKAGDATLTLPQAWALFGAFVIAPSKTDLANFPPATLQQLAKSLMPIPTQGPAAITWLPQGSTATSYSLANTIALQRGSTGALTTITLGPAALSIPSGTAIQIGTGPAATLALSNASGLSVALTQQQFTQQSLAANAGAIALDGPQVGAISLTIAGTSLFSLFAFGDPQLGGNGTVANGPDVRYYLAKVGDPVTELRFPVFAPAVEPGAQTGPTPASFTLQMQLDPIWPFDSSRTVMTPDLTAAGVPALFALPLLTTTAGAPLTLTPTSVNLYLAQNQSGGYVAPAGTFTIGQSARLLCGLLAQEHLLVNAGDALTLLPTASAYPGGFPALVIGSASTVVADDAIVTSSPLVPGAVFTTSWLQYAPAANASGAYYGQPQPSVSFSSGGLKTSVAAVAAKIASLTTETAAVPMTSYAAAYPPPIYSGTGTPPPGWPVGGTQFPGDVSQTWPNIAVAAADFAQAEHIGLAPMRYRSFLAQLSDALGPIFEVAGAPAAGASATTRQGFVVELNPQPNAGSWNNVVLASYQDEVVALAPPGSAQVLDAHLVTTLLASQLFMVVDQVPLAPAGSPGNPVTAPLNTMEVGGFRFDFNAKAGGQQILVFKFNDALSLNDLINQTAHWNTSYLQAQPTAAQATLQSAVAAAQAAVKSPDPTIAALFADFVNRILVEPNWTGVIAFNCAIDASKMPSSLAILIAAAVGQTITAHHFGVEISQVTQQGQQVAIKQSSLFGVIKYDAQSAPAPADFSFWTQTLHVQIRNSSVTQFQAAIRVALNKPFGRKAKCAGDENAVTLAGAYQQQGKLGIVTFSEADPGSAIYTFDRSTGLRVLDQLAVKSATLLPGTPTTSNGTTTIPGRIVMGGTLMFAANPFFAADPAAAVDLFGYGTGSGGLDFTGFTLDVTATLGSSGGQTTAEVDYSGMKVSAGRAAMRTGSLVSGLPCQVDAFLADTTDGLSADSLQAQSVHCLQLENVTVPAPVNPLQPPDPGADPPTTVQASYTTPAPNFAVTFDLPLGSLGNLADAHASLDSSLILGWGPSPTTPDDDAAAVLIKLPFASVGYGGFNLQGVLKTVFGDANLMQVPSAPGKPYVILFNNVQLSVFGIKLPPHVLSDLILFVPGNNTGNQPMGMCLMAEQT